MTHGLQSYEGRSFIIGREGHVLIDDISVSKAHAELSFVEGRIRLRDLNSTNGTYLIEGDRSERFYEGFVMPNQTIAVGTQRKKVQSLLDTIFTFTF